MRRLMYMYILQLKTAKYCEQLALNSLGSSLIDPQHHDLGLTNESWHHLFSARLFEDAMEMHKDIHCTYTFSSVAQSYRSTTPHFDGMVADLIGVFTAPSPLEQLQLLTSAFRKTMATLSNLKLQPLLQYQSHDQGKPTVTVILSYHVYNYCTHTHTSGCEPCYRQLR